jgi:hypothetical protein
LLKKRWFEFAYASGYIEIRQQNKRAVNKRIRHVKEWFTYQEPELNEEYYNTPSVPIKVQMIHGSSTCINIIMSGIFEVYHFSCSPIEVFEQSVNSPRSFRSVQ